MSNFVKILIFIVFVTMTSMMILFYLWSRAESASYRPMIAGCQLRSIATQIVDAEVDDGLSPASNLIGLIDLASVKDNCRDKIVVVDNKLYDVTGARLSLTRGSSGGVIVERVPTNGSEFISLSINLIELELDEDGDLYINRMD